MPQQEVVYLTAAPGLESPWVLQPDRPFRCHGLMAWGWHPRRTVIQSVLFAGDEQLAQPGPAYVFDARMSLADFLTKALREPVELTWPRLSLRGRWLSPEWPTSRLLAGAVLDLPAVNQRADIRIAFTGDLTALALVGVQLL